MYGPYAAQIGPAGIHHRQPDQVGVVKLIIWQGRQAFPRRIEPRALQRLGIFPCRHTGQTGCEALLDRAGDSDIKRPAILGTQRRIVGNGARLGTERLQFDIWGDTVNVASRMESTGEPGGIHVSEDFANNLDASGWKLEPRGSIDIKGKGELRTSWLRGHKIRGIS